VEAFPGKEGLTILRRLIAYAEKVFQFPATVVAGVADRRLQPRIPASDAPSSCPRDPAANVDKAAAYYVNNLGFTFDWGMTMEALQASRSGIADCSLPIVPSESPAAT